jgi:hypothetical protein
MARFNQTSFIREGYKRIFCINCGHFISESHLGEKHSREIICRECKTVNLVSPPRLEMRNPYLHGVSFGANNTMWTATPDMEEIDPSISR